MFNFLREYDDSDIKWALKRHEKKIESLEMDKNLIHNLKARIEKLEKKIALMEQGADFKLIHPDDRSIQVYFFYPSQAVSAARASGGTLTYYDEKLGVLVTRQVTASYPDPLEI